MKLESFFKTTTLLVIFFSLLYRPALATNGYFSHGYGTQLKGMAGAGVALFETSLAAATNPAALAFYGSGYDISLAYFTPNRKYTVIGNPTDPQFWPQGQMLFGLSPGTVASGNSGFIVPAVGANFMLNNTNAIGINIFGNGGMNTEYATKTFYSRILGSFPDNQFPNGQNPMSAVTQPTGVNISQLFTALNYAHSFGDHALGFSVIFAYQFFEATGLEAFRDMGMSANPAKLTGNGSSNSTGFGFKVGYQGELLSGLRLGASYQTRVNMSEFDEYAGLFAEQGDFDVPASWTAGLAFEPVAGQLVVAADVQQIMYSDIKSIANPMKAETLVPMVFDPGSGQLVPNPMYVPLGSDEAAGFGWNDMTVLKFGVQYMGFEEWTLRAGFSTTTQPIPESGVMFNILAPAVIENHISIGASKMLNGNEICVAVTRALSHSVKGENPFDPAQQIELTMDQWELEIGFGF